MFAVNNGWIKAYNMGQSIFDDINDGVRSNDRVRLLLWMNVKQLYWNKTVCSIK